MMKQLQTLHKQRGILGLGGLFSSKKKTKSEEETRRETEATREGTLERDVLGTERQVSETELLDRGIQEAVGGLIQQLVGAQSEGGVGADIGNVAELLLTRAEGAEEAVLARTGAIVGEARRTGERELTRLQTDLAQQAGGSTFNTFVQGATAEGRASLESQLAALQAQLGIQARGIETDELSNVVEAISTGAAGEAASSNAIAQLVNVLRGATARTETTGEQTQQETQRAMETLTELMTQLTKGETTTKGKPSLFDSFVKLIP